MAEQLWRKSILFEIVNKNNPSSPEWSFTLTIPPESIELTIPQRITRTKTFGGVFIDDYGTDNYKLSISGHTGGVTYREAYPNNMGQKAISGKDVIYELRDNLALYKDKEGRKGKLGDYEIHVYDLSAIESAFTSVTLSGVKPKIDAYVCSLDEFKITRNKDRPLWYQYHMEFFVIRSMGTPRVMGSKEQFNAQGAKSVTEIRTFQDFDKAMRAGLAKMNSDLAGLRDACDSVFKAYDEFASAIDSYIAGLKGFFDTFLVYPGTWAKNLMKRVLSLQNFVTGAPERFENYLKVEAGRDYMATMDMWNQMVYGSAYTVAAAKSQTSESIANSKIQTEASYIDQATGTAKVDDQTFVITGHIVETATSATTFESLAVEYFGTASMAVLIAQYNGIADIDQITPGMILRVPVLTEQSRASNNKIYDYDKRDVYGKDIPLDPDGNIQWSDTGDFGVTTGEDTLRQAIAMRFTEELGARTRLTTYGLMTGIGSSGSVSAPMAYLVASIVDTSMQDPRVDGVSNIVVRGEGDSLFYTFDILSIGGDNITVSGAI